MGRAKLKMELIENKKARNTKYQKRKDGIIKKANEFAILCDVDTVIIIYPPNSNEPEIWPENRDKIKKSIASYKAKKGESGKKTYNLNDFFEDRKKRIEDELTKARKKNMEAKYTTWFDDLNILPEGQLRLFAMALENKENIVRSHLEFMKRNMNIQLPFMGQYADLGSNPGLDHGQLVMNHLPLNNDGGWFSDAPMASFVPLKREPMIGFDYSMFNGGYVVNDNVNRWAFLPPPAPEFAMQNHGVGSQVNNGVGDFVMDGYRARFMG